MTINEAINIKTEKRIKAIELAEARRNELHAKISRIAQIDADLQDIPLRLISGEDPESLKSISESLASERARILEASGIEKDYDTPKFECNDCNDGGYCGIKLCHCVREMLSEQNYQESKLAGGLVGKTFESFSLSYYAEGKDRAQLEGILRGCKKYAENFPNDSMAGLLFTGGTGLGKTHLSAAIANTVASKGMSVIYESAQQIYDTLDAVRFNRAELAERKKYESCKLLIIDDLGAECITQYSVSAITSLIDLRIVNGRKTIISTNLDHNGIKRIYGERLYSRLLGEFRVLKFVGKDVRMQKIKGVND
ncbi:MAG: ATP-binding protein [Clostridia bacterium]|nr:ATP-binding protein [Clostridia bacterium]